AVAGFRPEAEPDGVVAGARAGDIEAAEIAALGGTKCVGDDVHPAIGEFAAPGLFEVDLRRFRTRTVAARANGSHVRRATHQNQDEQEREEDGGCKMEDGEWKNQMRSTPFIRDAKRSASLSTKTRFAARRG